MEVEIEGGEILSDLVMHQLGTLQGWGPVEGTRPGWRFTGEGAPLHTVSWVVRGKSGDQMTVEVRSERGGRHQRKVTLSNYLTNSSSPSRKAGIPSFIVYPSSPLSTPYESNRRIIHSGFLTSPDWDDEYDGVRCGWKFELFGLREYLENHRGKTRSVAWARAVTDAPAEEIWERLTGKEGLALEGASSLLKSGDPYAFKTVHGDSFQGITRASNPPKEFYGTVENMNHAILRVDLYRSQGKHEINVWLSAYDLPRSDVGRLQAKWQEMLKNLFPEAEIK